MTASTAEPSIFDRRLLVVSGKGGVGRTTVSAAIALAAAARGKRVLIAETQGQGRLTRLLGTGVPIGSQVVSVASHIDAVNMNPPAALREYGLMALKIEALYKAIFENRPVRAFLAAVPGLYAYSMLGKAWYHTTEQRGHKPRYDLVILDGPASGHAITMLKIPGAIVSTMPNGPLTRDAESMFQLLRDAEQCAFVVVTLPEELPAREALDLLTAARHTLQAPLGPLIVNGMPDAVWAAPDLRRALDAIASAPEPSPLQGTFAGVRALSCRRREAEPIVQRLIEKAGVPVLTLPRLLAPTIGPEEVRALATLLHGA